MNFALLIIITFIILQFNESFTNFKIGKIILTQKYMISISTSTIDYPEEDDYNKKKLKDLLMDKLTYEYEQKNYDNENNILKPLYTLIWYDCEKCKKLLYDMELLQLKKIYINAKYFDKVNNLNTDFKNPLLFKDDNYISDELFEIYEEIYNN
jgi:hypothetical protein